MWAGTFLKRTFFHLMLSVLLMVTTTQLSFGKPLVIATANTGGTYFPVGVALASLISLKLGQSDQLVATAVNSAGSGENIRMLDNGECDLAMLSGLYALQAYEGTGRYSGRPMRNMAAVAMLWDNVEHFALLNKYVKKGDLNDLKGLKARYSIGRRGSGTEGSTRVIFNALGIETDLDFEAEYLGYNLAVSDMLDDRLAGAALPAGPPVPAVTRLFATARERVSLLNVTDAQLEKINSSHKLWGRYIIRAGTYPGQKEDVLTMAYPNLLVASGRLDQEEVYKITKCIFENLDFFSTIHNVAAAISLTNSLDGSPVPIHPGAAKYYREVGLAVPDR